MSQRLRSSLKHLHDAVNDVSWRGSDPEGGNENGENGSQSGENGASGTGGQPNGESGEGEQQKPATQEQVSKADYEALQRRMKAADQATAAAVAKVKEFEDKNKDELTRATEEAETAKQEAAGLRKSLQVQQIANAFFGSNKVNWHNSRRALQVLDTSNVTIEDDGTVKGIDAAIDKLAKSDPYLVKPGGNDERPPSGDGKDGKGGNRGTQTDREALVKKYPALRR